MPGFSGFGNKLNPIKTNTANTTNTIPDPNASLEEKIAAKTDEKVDEKVDKKVTEVINQKSGDGLNV